MRNLMVLLAATAIACPPAAAAGVERWEKFASCTKGGICMGANSSAEGFLDFTKLPDGAGGGAQDRDHRSAKSMVYRPAHPIKPATLLLFLHGGNGGSADHAQSFMRYAAEQGYYVIGIDWMNDASAGQLCTCNGEVAVTEDCYARFAEQTVDGTDNGFLRVYFGPGAKWNGHRAYNSISRRVGLLLSKMATACFPMGDAGCGSAESHMKDWTQFIVPGEFPTPNWSRVVIAGHSDGSVVAAWILKTKVVTKGLFFSGPKTQLTRPKEEQLNAQGNRDYTSASLDCKPKDRAPDFFRSWSEKGTDGVTPSSKARVFLSYWDDRYEPGVTVPYTGPTDPYENGWKPAQGASHSRLWNDRGKKETRLTWGAVGMTFACPKNIDTLWTDWITVSGKYMDLPEPLNDHNATLGDRHEAEIEERWGIGFRECVWKRMLLH